MSLFSFCFNDLSIGKSQVLKSPTIIMWVSICVLSFSKVSFFIRYFFSLHFPFPSFSSENPLSHPPVPAHNPPNPSSLSCHSPILGHQAFSGLRASSCIDVQQDYPLLHMPLEPWVPSICTLWLVVQYLGAQSRIWLVDIVVLPMGWQIPLSAASVLSLTHQ